MNLPIFFFALVVCCVFMTTVLNAQKFFPSNTNRNFRCPSFASSIPPDYFSSKSNYNDNIVNHNLLDIVPELANISNIAVIMVKRDSKDGTPYFKYFGNGQENYAIETWSSSKIFETLNAANTMKKQCRNSTAGLSNFDYGKYGQTFLGDLITLIVTYSTDFPPYSSNALGGWFSVVGGRKNAVDMVLNWLNCTSTSGETCSLGANYGNPPPADLQMQFYNPNSPSQPCDITPDSYNNGNNSNTLSALAAAEMIKRIVLSRELPADQNFPGTTYGEDIQNLLYGAKDSKFFPQFKGWGGMTANGLDMIRNGLNMSLIEERSAGNWRTFSKDGGGVSVVRHPGQKTGESLYNGYACYPNLQNQDSSVEYIVSSRVSIIGDDNGIQAYTTLQNSMGILNQAIFDGRLK